MSAEQKNRFGLRGYAAAYILPDGFEAKCGGVEIVSQGAANYACITICAPFSNVFEYIPTAYKKVLGYLKENGFKENVHTNAGYTHRTLFCDGKYYDPEFGLIEGEYKHGKVTSFPVI